MSKAQADKVSELTAGGWKAITPLPPPGGPIVVQDPAGNRFTVDSVGNVIPKPDKE